MQLTISRSSQQNGMMERKKQNHCGDGSKYAKRQKLIQQIQSKAVHTTICILNQSPTKDVRHKTPFEAWSKTKPKVNHLKDFGCSAHALISSINQDKFDKKREKLIFIGCSNESKEYQLFNPKTNKLIVSRYVFDEIVAWGWEGSSSQVPVT